MEESESYFDHEADIGIIGRGQTIADAFVSAAESTFAIMTDLSKIEPLKSIDIEFEETDIELALVTWINNLIADGKAAGLILGRFQLQQNDSHWMGKAWGEPWRDDLIRGTEVKGATLTMLSVKKINKGWEARCVVDV